MKFNSDYTNILKAAKNIETERFSLYEHNIDADFMEKYFGKEFRGLLEGNMTEKLEYMKIYTSFFKRMGYDSISFETCIGPIMPGSGALGGHKEGVIKNRADFNAYPFDEIPDMFFSRYNDYYLALKEVMPIGMKAIGGPGNGVFECVQEIVGYTSLCYMLVDDPLLYSDLFERIGNMIAIIWKRFMNKYGELYCICRFGDDLGFKSQTLITKDSIIKDVIPQYRKVTDIVHSFSKPFLLHSCGNLFEVMDEIVTCANIDAKHSNEDQIAPFEKWVNDYGDRIGNFGGIDMDVLCRCTEKEIKEYVNNILINSKGHGGIAIGSGNSIPNYIPVEGYLAMVEAIHDFNN